MAHPSDHAPQPSPTGDAARPIGVFDSGVGGLSIVRELRRQLPAEDLIYVADQAHVPYGPRPIADVRAFTEAVTRWLLRQHVKLVVIACNTASAAALHPIRALFPDTPFVGMEPAVKPAAQQTQTGVIGVIATEVTFQGKLFESVVGRFAQNVAVVTQACPEFVLLAEQADTHSDHTRAVIRRRLAPLLDAGIDQLVLGCTHFPFLTTALQDVIGPGVTIVDPSAAVARQAGRVLAQRDQLHPAADNDPRNPGGSLRCYTTGDPSRFYETARALLGDGCGDRAAVHALAWTAAGDLVIPTPHPSDS